MRAVDGDGAGASCSITHKGEVIKEAKGESMPAAGGCVAVSPVAGRTPRPQRLSGLDAPDTPRPTDRPDLRAGPIVSAMVHGGKRIGSTDPEGDP
ncbi:hypothetical protein GCM10015535_29940 [Streptomyces gelaticus]|uniref:DUF397 domain-containing protein n=1 Tax=Streptomyces gelaticus TaxID=285446 RepID=A0ABQ2VYB9_9ACTN|nr:hypothetical protein GCM10015535_29940 [Streptomyces gelaticus]